MVIEHEGISIAISSTANNARLVVEPDDFCEPCWQQFIVRAVNKEWGDQPDTTAITALGEDKSKVTGVEQIAAERARQIAEEGWTTDRDRRVHRDGELALAACCYAAPKDLFVHETRQVQLNASRGADPMCYQYEYGDRLDWYDPWPWDEEWDKRDKHDRRHRLVIAGALIAAEIDRLAGDTV